ncbi:MAG: hypothetical protein ACRC0L_05255, partial [Angustibacter sp.]
TPSSTTEILDVIHDTTVTVDDESSHTETMTPNQSPPLVPVSMAQRLKRKLGRKRRQYTDEQEFPSEQELPVNTALSGSGAGEEAALRVVPSVIRLGSAPGQEPTVSGGSDERN